MFNSRKSRTLGYNNMLGRFEAVHMNEQITIILVHGAGTGPWIWRRLQDALPEPSEAVEVPSRRGDATLASCAEQIVKAI